MVKLVHFEIPSTDLKRSKEFYEALFGWEIELMPEMNYALINIKDGIGGGFNNDAKPAREFGFSFYFDVDDIPATIAKAARLGGAEVTPKTAIGGGEMGYFGVFSDPDGNLIGLWSRA